MDDSRGVRGCQASGELPGDLDGLSTAKMPDPSQQRGEILPGDVLHRQVQTALRLADVVDAADVRMRDLARHANLASQVVSGVLVRSQYGQELERDGLTELEVVRAVDLAHAASAERRDDAEATGEDGARGESFTTGRTADSLVNPFFGVHRGVGRDARRDGGDRIICQRSDEGRQFRLPGEQRLEFVFQRLISGTLALHVGEAVRVWQFERREVDSRNLVRPVLGGHTDMPLCWSAGAIERLGSVTPRHHT